MADKSHNEAKLCFREIISRPNGVSTHPTRKSHWWEMFPAFTRPSETFETLFLLMMYQAFSTWARIFYYNYLICKREANNIHLHTHTRTLCTWDWFDSHTPSTNTFSSGSNGKTGVPEVIQPQRRGDNSHVDRALVYNKRLGWEVRGEKWVRYWTRARKLSEGSLCLRVVIWVRHPGCAFQHSKKRRRTSSIIMTRC